MSVDFFIGGKMKPLFIFFSFLFIFNTSAKDGSSGCGPGWYILKKNSILSSALRVTTNGIFFPTTTIGMTLGTSNCSRHQIVKNEMKSLHFVTHNYYELKAEAAKGSGEYLMALNEVLGCNPKSALQFTRKMKSTFKEVFESKNPESVLLNIYKAILRDKSLVQSCTLS